MEFSMCLSTPVYISDVFLVLEMLEYDGIRWDVSTVGGIF